MEQDKGASAEADRAIVNGAASVSAVPASVPSAWQPIETAPKDGTAFIALNHDSEIWPAKFTADGRLCFRTNSRQEPRKFLIHNIDGKRLLEEDEQFAKDGERWLSSWTLWTRLYDFKPTHWMHLPNPPSAKL